MAVTHTWTTACKPSTLASMPSGSAVQITGDFANDVEELVTAGANKQVFAGLIDHTKIVSFAMHVDQPAVTIFTNSSSGAGGQSFALGTGKAEGWYSGQTAAGTAVSNPITGDVSSVWVDASGAAKDVTFRMSVLSLLA